MKIAILNLSNNVFKPSTVSSFETIAYKQLFERQGHDVDVISNKQGDYTISFEDVKDINDYDRLLVVNGAINFFGGVESPTIIKNYKLMNKYVGTIYYMFTDFRLPLRQLWPAIAKRDWGHSEDEVIINNDIVILSQGSDLEMTRKVHQGHDLNVVDVIYVPLERYKLETLEQAAYTDREYEFDLIYGGSFRSGKRLKEFEEYFFDTPYNAALFGTIKRTQFKNNYEVEPTFLKKVKPQEMINETSRAKFTLVMGDAEYNDNFITLRLWEALMSDAVVLINDAFDPQHKIFPNEPWRYVKSKQDINELVNNMTNYDLYVSIRKQRDIIELEKRKMLLTNKLLYILED